MHILLGLFIFMLGSSVLMVGYVLTRDIKYKKSILVEIADAGDDFFEEIQPVESNMTEYDYRQKTA